MSISDQPKEWLWRLEAEIDSPNGINNDTFRFAHLERLEAIYEELHEIRVKLGSSAQVQSGETGGEGSTG